jgi:hypothetical protein
VTCIASNEAGSLCLTGGRDGKLCLWQWGKDNFFHQVTSCHTYKSSCKHETSPTALIKGFVRTHTTLGVKTGWAYSYSDEGVEFDPQQKNRSVQEKLPIRGHCHMQGVPVIPVNKVVEKKRTIGKRGLRRKRRGT